MSDTEFTPGPWRLGYAHAVVADSTEGLTIRGSIKPEYYGGNMIAESVAPANCHLISAAPELYEALQGTVRILDALLSEGFTGYVEDSRKVKAALAKARGEQKQEKSQ